MGNHYPIILAKEIGEFTLYLTGPKTIDDMVDDGNVTSLTELRDEFEILVRMLNHKIDDTARGLDSID